MIEQDNVKSYKKSINLINVTSILVILISLFFTYQYLTPFNQIKNADPQKLKENEINNDKEETFLDKFKRLDLSVFIKKNLIDENEQFKPSIVDKFNNNQLLPRLLSIVDMDYFKYVKLNLNKKCSLWSDDAKCSRKDCTIHVCDESRLPDYIKEDNESKEFHQNRKADADSKSECTDENLNVTDDKLDKIVRDVISNDKLITMNDLFECYVSEYEDGEFYDLKMNPEQFTGYKGTTAHRIWRSIYEENCFKSKKIHQLNVETETNANNVQLFESILNVDDLCLEEKIFYRAISGLHTSINIHLSRYYHFKDGSIDFNLKEFLRRFEG